MNKVTKEKWHTSRMEVARGPMKAVTEPGVRTLSVMCCTQLMKTELILNTIGYFSHLDPCPILIVQPKKELAQKFSHVRLKQMIESTPELEAAYSSETQKNASNTALYKEFLGGQLAIVSAKVPADLAMLAIRVVLLDEIDKYDESAGKEGDPVDLAEERMSKYASNSLSIRACSPTVKDFSRIEASYENSDMRKPHVRCPHCDHWQVMYWRNVVWDKTPTGEAKIDTARYSCSGCGAIWSEFERHQALKDIRWLQTASFFCDCGHENKPATWDPNEEDRWDGHLAKCENCGHCGCSNSHAGFWANKIYSTFRPLSEMVKKWVEAQGNVEKLRMFINTQLAETFEENSEQIKDLDWLLARRERYPAELPEEVGVLTAGVDVQPNRLEIEVVGWGKDEESWSIDHKVIPGDPSDPDTWDRINSYLNQPWFRYDGKCTYVAAACIDMHGGYTQEVTSFCRTKINRKFWPIRGVGGDGQARPVWPSNPSRGGQYDTPFYNVGVDSAKNTVFARLLIQDSGPGYCHFPESRSSEWFQQLTAEKRVTKWKGARKILVWDNPRKARNEAFDCRVYAYAALCGLISEGLIINDVVDHHKFIMSKPIVPKQNQQQESTDKENVLKNNTTKVKSKRQRVVKSSFMSH